MQRHREGRVHGESNTLYQVVPGQARALQVHFSLACFVAQISAIIRARHSFNYLALNCLMPIKYTIML